MLKKLIKKTSVLLVLVLMLSACCFSFGCNCNQDEEENKPLPYNARLYLSYISPEQVLCPELMYTDKFWAENTTLGMVYRNEDWDPSVHSDSERFITDTTSPKERIHIVTDKNEYLKIILKTWQLPFDFISDMGIIYITTATKNFTNAKIKDLKVTDGHLDVYMKEDVYVGGNLPAQKTFIIKMDKQEINSVKFHFEEKEVKAPEKQSVEQPLMPYNAKIVKWEVVAQKLTPGRLFTNKFWNENSIDIMLYRNDEWNPAEDDPSDYELTYSGSVESTVHVFQNKSDYDKIAIHPIDIDFSKSMLIVYVCYNRGRNDDYKLNNLSLDEGRLSMRFEGIGEWRIDIGSRLVLIIEMDKVDYSEINII